MGRGEKVLKKLTVLYIQNDLTFGYIAQVLNFVNSHSFSNMRLTRYFFFLRILIILTHTHEKRGKGLKETDSNLHNKHGYG